VAVVRQLAEMAKERDAARANAKVADLVTRLALKKGGENPGSKACTLQ
jgi:hypothetical protein|tara:strand:+ start:95 stop:238 length:144 start_codon:yes stop_codon:yes gene_type:complete